MAGERTIKGSRFSDEQIAYALRQAAAGTAVADVRRQLAVSEATFYAWKTRVCSLGAGLVIGEARQDAPYLRR